MYTPNKTKGEKKHEKIVIGTTLTKNRIISLMLTRTLRSTWPALSVSCAPWNTLELSMNTNTSEVKVGEREMGGESGEGARERGRKEERGCGCWKSFGNTAMQTPQEHVHTTGRQNKSATVCGSEGQRRRD